MRGYEAIGEPQAGEELWAVFKARESRIENAPQARMPQTTRGG